MMNSIRHNHPSPFQCLRVFYYWSLLCYFAATAVAAATVILSLLLSPFLQWLSHHFATDTLLQILSLSGVVEFKTQLLILENILWLPFVSNQQIWVEYSTLENCCDPLYLWVIIVYSTDDCGKLKSKDSNHTRRSKQNTYHVANKNIAPSKVTIEQRRTRGCLPGASPSLGLDRKSVV